MNHYDCDWCQWYSNNQRGGEWQIYRGKAEQRGYNPFFSALRRYGIPALKKGIKWIGKQTLETGREWMRDVMMDNEPPKQALKKRIVKAARKAAMDGFDKLEKRVAQSGSGP